jgi:hypothetical protein
VVAIVVVPGHVETRARARPLRLLVSTILPERSGGGRAIAPGRGDDVYLGGSGFALELNARSRRIIASVSLPEVVNSISPLADGQTVYIGTSGLVERIDLHTGRVLFRLALPGLVTGVVADPHGGAAIVGVISSPALPVKHAWQRKIHGASDAFVLHVDSRGHIVFSTYLGGVGADSANAVALDREGDALVVGTTESTHWAHRLEPTGWKNRVHHPGADAFVAKFSPTGRLRWTASLGGDGDDFGNAVAVAQGGTIIAAGATTSSNYPTVAALDNRFAGGECGIDEDVHSCSDGFVTRLSANGRHIVSSTYIGGGLDDSVSGVTGDSKGNIDVVGTTASTNFPRVRAAQSRLGGGECGVNPCSDAFASQFDPSARHLEWSTLLGGNGLDSGEAVCAKPHGRVFLTGTTQSQTFPAVHALHGMRARPGSPFLVELEF